MRTYACLHTCTQCVFTLHLLTCFIFLHILIITFYISLFIFLLSVSQLLPQLEYKLCKSIDLVHLIHYSIANVQNNT